MVCGNHQVAETPGPFFGVRAFRLFLQFRNVILFSGSCHVAINGA
ncbi:hypothetical protein SAMN05421874_104365 [Nonomuraea maritima]|uniref:Uncharacterized protein n=1 Tax=Nonomuraea maritima TaxID=683260 RepID=A0A1G8YFL8_9ACTN|nr:hypothetical protein SAMN05421874_104365 [Nonomuraea maritima]